MKNEHWLIEGINQWEQLFGGFNWYTFTAIQLEFENDAMTHGYEFIFIVLGLGFRIRYNTDEALEQFDEWEKEAKEILHDT